MPLQELLLFRVAPPNCILCLSSYEIFIEQRQQMENSNEKIFDKRFMTYIDKNDARVQVDNGLIVGRILKACHSIITDSKNIGKAVGILSRNNRISFHYDNLKIIKQKLKETCKDYKDVYPYFDKNIRVGTTHSFKGLETDIIIMLNVNNGNYPTIHPDNELYEIFGATQADILAEEERLFYVGVTRAKTALYILCEKENESEYLKRFDLSEYKVNYFYDDKIQNIVYSSPRYSDSQYSNSQYTQDERKSLSKSASLAAFYRKRT